MKIIPRYIMQGFLLTFVIALLVFTFVMCTMVLFRVSDFIAAGGDLRVIGKIFLAGLPSALGFSIPISVLTSALLTFGRLSASGEISAMKAGGISMKRIALYPALFSLLLAGICLYLNAEITPLSYFIRRQAIWSLGIETPIALIEEGRFIRDFPNFTFFIGGKKGNRIWDVIIYQHEPGRTLRNIRAKSGTISMSPDKTALLVDLIDVRLDPFYEDRPGVGEAKHFPLKVDLGRSPNVPYLKAPRAYVRPGHNTLRLTADCTGGYRLDPQAASEVFLEVAGEGARFSGGARKLAFSQPYFPLVIPFTAEIADESPTLTAHFKLNYARRSGPRLPFSKEAFLAIPVSVSADVTNRLVVAAYHVSQDKKRSDMTLGELRQQVQAMDAEPVVLEPEAHARQRMGLIVEYHKRIVMALSCLAFVLLGVPLATRTHRSESSIGVALSLFLVFNFYLFIIIADSLAKKPALHSYVICWIPIALSLALGALLIRRCE
jgi:lipopolysaccharide export LptBFGC system permease protein LptF